MNDATSTIDFLKRIRIDAMFEKKKHYNAADRFKQYHSRLSTAFIILSAGSGSSSFTFLLGLIDERGVWVSALLSIVLAVLLAINTQLKFDEEAMKHKESADSFIELMKSCDELEAQKKDGAIRDKKFIAKVSKFKEKYAMIIRVSPVCSNADYEKAKKSVEAGEEVYTNQEMDL